MVLECDIQTIRLYEDYNKIINMQAGTDAHQTGGQFRTISHLDRESSATNSVTCLQHGYIVSLFLEKFRCR